ncbi:GNAT family N-acetyltransferase [Mucilaginibacter aquatilis]|uniref:GNAT family N-acetyltransferase n=1 Tax=Mucilaginibacter aquatilis TaxID=1517760 RepID=A0A6I4I8E5_9SPHI|nr:GNAT family N-acetyltransferase [Mucilaginibacter aquatilis]MVN91332.1 GNAT family N-acetyltransferase [Mucilaginibacter aquatilis]
MQITLKRTNSGDKDFKVLVTQLDKDLRDRNGDVMDLYDEHNVIEEIETVVIGYLDSIPVACGCFKKYDANTAEVKRMYVAAQARGKGLSFEILTELEQWASALNYKYLILETGNKQIEAHGLYKKANYKQIPAYGVYRGLPDSVCFKKELKPSAL